MIKRKNLQRIFFVLIAIATIAGLYAFKEFNRKTKSLHDVKAVAHFKSTEITAQFTNDEKKATVAYSGKAIVVNGRVKTIDKDEKGFYTIVLGDEGSMSSVRCSIDSTESSKTLSVQTNSIIKIKGICTGYNADEMGLGSDVILNRCVIEPAK